MVRTVCLTTVKNPVATESAWANAFANLVSKQRFVRDFTKLVTKCSAAHKWKIAFQVFLAMRQASVQADVQSITTLLAVCTKGQMWQDALFFLGAERCQDWHTDGRAQSALIKLFGRAEKWEAALDAFWTCRQRRVILNAVTFTAAIGACATPRAWQEAFNLLEVAEVSGEFPSVVPYSAAIGVAGKSGQWQQALAVLERARSVRVQLDAQVHSAALQACAVSMQWQLALQLCEKWRVPVADSVFAVFGKCANWQVVLSLLDSSHQRGKSTKESILATMRACSHDLAWSQALALLDQSFTHPDLAGAVIDACQRAGKWHVCLAILKRARTARLAVDANAFANTVRALGRISAWERALTVWEDARKQRVEDSRKLVLSAVVCACQISRIHAPLQNWPDVERGPSKETEVLDFVMRNAQRGNIDSVVRTVEQFAQDKQWLKIMGGAKAELVANCLRGGDTVLELGGYIGFSALILVRHLRQLGSGGKVLSIELSPACALIAESVVRYAGASSEAQVLVGRAEDWLAFHPNLPGVDVLVLDHRGTRYHEDLNLAEPLLKPGARVLVDNVLHPGAPLLLPFISGRYEFDVHETKEFQRDALDDWVIVARPSDLSSSPVLPPPELIKLAGDIDDTAWRSQRGPVPVREWRILQRRVEVALRPWLEFSKCSTAG